MRPLAFFAPAAAVIALATAAQAQEPNVTVTLGPKLQEQVEDLGPREVRDQADRLAERVREALARRNDLNGTAVNLVLTDLKPNRPTLQQLTDRPSLDRIRSVSIGGAAVKGEIVTADGRNLPFEYDRFNSSLADVYGFSTWWEADRVFDRVARKIAEGDL
ncbi:hypothetical protein [uncultured Brevundimonas sp.]|uniref:hypothetical protein n=1 Tax=uncultured Brevundimonas sp. TaxID=213418 RepID=UPI0025EB4D40|nr:hypothetical protein [uncultured Brevundimonas sp.]